MKTKVFNDMELSEIYLYLLKGDLPVKYAYKTDLGSKSWLNLENAKEKKYKSFSEYETDLLLKNFDIYLKYYGDEIIIFDFGPGDGKTMKIFLSKMINYKKIIYHAFDISEKIIESNRKTIKSISDKIKYDYTIIDFEDSSFFEKIIKIKEKYDNNKVLSLFLGSTIGNFYSIQGILQNMLKPFSSEDMFLIGVSKSDLKNKNWINSIVKAYNTENVFNLCYSTIGELGVDRKDIKIYSVFDENKSCINMLGEFKKDIDIKVKDKIVKFKKNNIIRLGKSEKFDNIKLIKYLSDLNVRIDTMISSDDDKYIQLVLVNKRFI